jgi:hypothetical protein
MLAQRVFFSFAEVTDPGRHREYNEWHQLDHRPENLALDGVLHGERWVRTPECARRGVVGSPGLAGTHYVNMYWFREPADASFRQWQELAERSFQRGRRPDTGLTERPLMGLFATIAGYASPRVLVSPDALPFRPVRGVWLSLVRLLDPRSPRAHRYLGHRDRVAIPRLLRCRGVAGAYAFSSLSTTIDPSWRPVPGSVTFDASGSDAGSLRAELLFLDADPLDTLAERQDAERVGADPDDEEAVRVLFSTALYPIQPWSWDWFDGEAHDQSFQPPSTLST